MSLLATRLESSLCHHLGTILPGLPIYPGHSNDIVESLPRLICTIASGGGPLMQTAGVDQLSVEIQILATAGDTPEDPDPIATLARISDAVRSALCLDSLPTVLAAINAHATGPDTRAIRGLGLIGMEYEGHKEGRDPERALHGVILTYAAWAYLTA